MHRLLLLLSVAALLSGCTAPEAPGGGDLDGADAKPADPAATGPTQVLAGNLTWHSAETQGVLMPVTAATQPVFNECIASDSGEVWVSNLDLRAAGATAPVPDGARQLEVLFSWDLTDYPKDRLVLAYQPTGGAVVESDWIQNGEATLVDVEPDQRGGNWGFWACVSRAGSTTNTDPSEGPKPFLGDLTFRISVPA